jgi:hypothetical protein
VNCEADLHTPERSIHEGLDDWIFLAGRSNYVTTLYDPAGGNLPETTLRLWRKRLEQRAARCRAGGIKYLHVVVPDKLTVYGHKQATPLVDPDLSPALRLAEMMRSFSASDAFLDLVSPMRDARDKAALYWKSDTHWTPEGCVLAYQSLCAPRPCSARGAFRRPASRVRRLARSRSEALATNLGNGVRICLCRRRPADFRQ